MQNFSFHMHTIGFDGRNTVEEMVQAARDADLEKIGISNHFIVHQNIKDSKMYQYAVRGNYHTIYNASFEEAVEKFKSHYEEIDRVKEKTGFPVYKGMEADFFLDNRWKEGFEKACEILKPDYIIGATHFVVLKGEVYNSHDLKNAAKEEQNMLLYKYYQNIRAAAKSKMFDFFAHLDLMKKVGLGLESVWEDIESQTVEVLALHDARVEINTSGFHLPCGEPYPSMRLLKMLAKYDVPVIISDDAHNKERIADRFDAAENLAIDAGIKNFYEPFEGTQSSINVKEISTGRQA